MVPFTKASKQFQKDSGHHKATIRPFDCTGCPHIRIRPWTQALDRIAQGIRGFPRSRPRGCRLGLDVECPRARAVFEQRARSISLCVPYETEELQQMRKGFESFRPPSRPILFYLKRCSLLLVFLLLDPAEMRLTLLSIRDIFRCIREKAFNHSTGG